MKLTRITIRLPLRAAGGGFADAARSFRACARSWRTDGCIVPAASRAKPDVALRAEAPNQGGIDEYATVRIGLQGSGRSADNYIARPWPMPPGHFPACKVDAWQLQSFDASAVLMLPGGIVRFLRRHAGPAAGQRAQ